MNTKLNLKSMFRSAIFGTLGAAMFLTLGQMTQAADHAVHTIKYADVGNDMEDGDNISVVETKNVCPSDEIEIKLVLGSGVSWWKGAILFKKDKDNDYLSLVELQDDKKSKTGRVSYDDFSSRHFVLSKAKAFGVHTNMYYIEDAPQKMTGGNRYTFTWTKD
ncbi:hypothetical protein [Rubinisphaera italica]|uniref:Uncharacterized protein n=1 Tax=Rubinisphaera italica TaxID=2527969 RepID=A0A5C5XK83_9PLAN|nr:hypothetical protein [Rubinisphaera italica]TWT63264.1 hypothetical protein Pan54_40170 [Rubinisphaera italica]